MPKLPSQQAQKAKEAAESSGFTPLEPGDYKCRLTDVKATTARESQNPMWVWELEVVQEGARGRKLWVNTVLTEKAMWKVGEMFAAFGRDTDSDTDEIIGEHCIATVEQRVIQRGSRAGQTGNDVVRCNPVDSESSTTGNEEAVAAGVAGNSGDEGSGEGW